MAKRKRCPAAATPPPRMQPRRTNPRRGGKRHPRYGKKDAVPEPPPFPPPMPGFTDSAGWLERHGASRAVAAPEAEPHHLRCDRDIAPLRAPHGSRAVAAPDAEAHVPFAQWQAAGPHGRGLSTSARLSAAPTRLAPAPKWTGQPQTRSQGRSSGSTAIHGPRRGQALLAVAAQAEPIVAAAAAHPDRHQGQHRRSRKRRKDNGVGPCVCHGCDTYLGLLTRCVCSDARCPQCAGSCTHVLCNTVVCSAAGICWSCAGAQQHRAHSDNEAVDVDAPVCLDSGLEQGESESPVDLDSAIETEQAEASGGGPSVHDGDTASETSQESSETSWRNRRRSRLARCSAAGRPPCVGSVSRIEHILGL